MIFFLFVFRSSLCHYSSIGIFPVNPLEKFFLFFSGTAFACANIVPNAIRPVWARHGTAFAISSDVSPYISTTYDSWAGASAT